MTKKQEKADKTPASPDVHCIFCRWVHKAPHLPHTALREALFNAAFHDGPDGLASSTGMVIVTAGARSNT